MQAFLKYEGIYESYRHLATSHIYYQQKKSTRISMKTTLKQVKTILYSLAISNTSTSTV